MVGSSTFGTAGGYVMPGLLMGLLQIGWFAVGTFFSADYILRGLGMESKPGTLPFVSCACLWGVTMAFAGAKGVQYVSKIALFLNAIPLLMLLVVFFQTSGGIGNYQVAAGAAEFVRRIHHDDRHRDRLLRHGGRGGCGFRHERAR